MKAFLTFLFLFAGAAQAYSFSLAEYKGEYEVPVREELRPFAIYPMEAVTVKYDGDGINISYEMPVTLTGAVNRVEMRGIEAWDGSLSFSGPLGTAVCAAPRGESCRMSFRGLAINLDLAAQALDLAGASPEEKFARLEITRGIAAMGGDMEGFLRYRRALQ